MCLHRGSKVVGQRCAQLGARMGAVQPLGQFGVGGGLFGGAGLALTAGVVETPSFLFALELMNTTHMMSLQPAALIQKYVDRGLLSRIPVELPDRMPSYGLITRLGEPPTPSAQAFIDVLRETAGVAPDTLGE